MPREIVHWTSIEQTIAAYSSQARGSRLGIILNEHRPYAYLGAVAQDAGYFCICGTVDLAEFISEVLHGSHGEDTFAPIHALVLEALKRKSPDQERLLAFALGMYSHALVDIHFHPMVYYLTGDYYHKDPAERLEARRRHRLFETYLDVWFSNRTKSWNKNSVSTVIDAIGSEINVVYDGLSEAIEVKLNLFTTRPVPGRPKLVRLWPGSFLSLSALQTAFRSSGWGLLFRGIFSVFKPMSAIDALFLLGRKRELELFNGPIRFTNPWSGESTIKSIDQLMTDVLADSVKLFTEIENILDSRNHGQLGAIQGRSLNSGIFGSKIDGARFFGVDPQIFADLS